MKIKSVQAFALRLPAGSRADAQSSTGDYGDYFIGTEAWTAIYSHRLEACLVRIEAEDGTVGWGEGQAPVSPQAVATLVNQLCRPVLLGQNPQDPGYLWYRMYSAMRERGHVTGFYLDALAGVDLALYDLLGKQQGLPVHRLLGGRFRERVPVYTGFWGESPEAAAARATEYRALGYPALKLHLRQPDAELIAVVRAVRETVGDSMPLMVDIHGTRDVSGAIRLGRALEALGVHWLESPVLAEDAAGHAEVARALDLAVASGEWLRSSWQWREWLERRAVDIAMPDTARTGFWEGMRIAALCDAWNIPVSPHVGSGGILAVAASVHQAAAVPNLDYLEHFHARTAHRALIATRYPEPIQGAYMLDDTPGLGVEIDEAKVKEFAV